MNRKKKNINMVIIILIAFSQQIGLAVITPSLPEMARELSVSIFAIMGLYMIGMGVGQIFWGSWSDILGRKKLMSIGVFVFAAASFFITLTASPYLINLLRFAQGFSTGAMYSISQAIRSKRNKRIYDRVNSCFRFWFWHSMDNFTVYGWNNRFIKQLEN